MRRLPVVDVPRHANLVLPYLLLGHPGHG